jgi:hypothetical protein
MCTLFSLRVQDVWLLGPEIGQIWSSSTLPPSPLKAVYPALHIHRVADWKSFSLRAFNQQGLCPKPVILVADVTALSHKDIHEIRQCQTQNPLFSPIIFFDQPDFAKTLHTFKGDLAGYCMALDTEAELRHTVRVVSEGRKYYSQGFSWMLEDFGFPVGK